MSAATRPAPTTSRPWWLALALLAGCFVQWDAQVDAGGAGASTFGAPRDVGGDGADGAAADDVGAAGEEGGTDGDADAGAGSGGGGSASNGGGATGDGSGDSAEASGDDDDSVPWAEGTASSLADDGEEGGSGSGDSDDPEGGGSSGSGGSGGGSPGSGSEDGAGDDDDAGPGGDDDDAGGGSFGDDDGVPGGPEDLPAGPADVQVTALATLYGAVAPGQSRTYEVYVQNVGGAAAICSVVLTSPGFGVFTIDPPTPTFVLAPASSQRFDLTFAPTAIGSYATELRVSHDGVNPSPQILLFQGSGGLGESSCDDTVDNDGDGGTDCTDDDCLADPACVSGDLCCWAGGPSTASTCDNPAARSCAQGLDPFCLTAWDQSCADLYRFSCGATCS